MVTEAAMHPNPSDHMAEYRCSQGGESGHPEEHPQGASYWTQVSHPGELVPGPRRHQLCLQKLHKPTTLQLLVNKYFFCFCFAVHLSEKKKIKCSKCEAYTIEEHTLTT